MSQPMYRPVADGEILNSNGLLVEAADPDGWLLRFGEGGPTIWFPDGVRLCEVVANPDPLAIPVAVSSIIRGVLGATIARIEREAKQACPVGEGRAIYNGDQWTMEQCQAALAWLDAQVKESEGIAD